MSSKSRKTPISSSSFAMSWKLTGSPKPPPKKILVEQMAVSHWSQVRLGRASVSLFQEDEPLAKQLPLLDRVNQHTATLQRSFHRALKELRSQQARRQASQGHPDEQEDQPRNVLKVSQGLAWIDKNGNSTMVAPPAILDLDGNYHNVDPDLLEQLLNSG